MFSSPRSRKKTASPGGTPGGIAFDAKSVLKHDVGKERKFRTKVHRKTLDPVFNELFIVHGELSTLIAGPLEVKVLDSDAISKDDPLGTLELDLSPLGAEGGDDSPKPNPKPKPKPNPNPSPNPNQARAALAAERERHRRHHHHKGGEATDDLASDITGGGDANGGGDAASAAAAEAEAAALREAFAPAPQQL